ncbi:hypothetical protein [Metakosakonia massiliensis]|uniref:RHS protein n=1 Tax=Phytobacter massiliensis TaxID=1485952 RepID=A0A6N3AHY8_9ENTR
MAQGSEDCAEWQTFVCEPGTHRPLALVDGHNYRHPHRLRPQVYWYQTDHTGTPHSLTDIRGRVVYRCTFTAYGKLLDEAFYTDERTGKPLINVRNPLRFQGQYEDDESGLF